MKLTSVDLIRISLPLVSPFRTSFGIEQDRDILLVRVTTPESEGWGECVAMHAPLYSSEYAEAAQAVIRDHFLPRLFSEREVRAEHVAPLLHPLKGHRMAKAAVELALLDAELRADDRPLADYLGGTKDEVAAGVSVGIHQSIPELLDAVAGYLEQGYARIKLKIEPGWDVEPVGAVRTQFGSDLLLQVDANTAYTRADTRRLAKLDAFDLLLIEQPLDEDDLLGHAQLARELKTPICLDESITSAATAVQAIELGACEVVNIKAGRVGGYLEAKKIHDVAEAHGIPVWCGGMLETGVGRAANIALASLPNFTLPGDTSASNRYYARDITEPIELHDGTVRVPRGPGIGVTPIPGILEDLTTSVETLAP